MSNSITSLMGNLSLRDSLPYISDQKYANKLVFTEADFNKPLQIYKVRKGSEDEIAICQIKERKIYKLALGIIFGILAVLTFSIIFKPVRKMLEEHFFYKTHVIYSTIDNVKLSKNVSQGSREYIKELCKALEEPEQREEQEKVNKCIEKAKKQLEVFFDLNSIDSLNLSEEEKSTLRQGRVLLIESVLQAVESNLIFSFAPLQELSEKIQYELSNLTPENKDQILANIKNHIKHLVTKKSIKKKILNLLSVFEFGSNELQKQENIRCLALDLFMQLSLYEQELIEEKLLFEGNDEQEQVEENLLPEDNNEESLSMSDKSSITAQSISHDKAGALSEVNPKTLDEPPIGLFLQILDEYTDALEATSNFNDEELLSSILAESDDEESVNTENVEELLSEDEHQSSIKSYPEYRLDQLLEGDLLSIAQDQQFSEDSSTFEESLIESRSNIDLIIEKNANRGLDQSESLVEKKHSKKSLLDIQKNLVTNLLLNRKKALETRIKDLQELLEVNLPQEVESKTQERVTTEQALQALSLV